MLNMMASKTAVATKVAPLPEAAGSPEIPEGIGRGRVDAWDESTCWCISSAGKTLSGGGLGDHLYPTSCVTIVRASERSFRG